MLFVDVHNTTRTHISRSRFRSLAMYALSCAGRKRATVGVVFVGESRIRSLNARYREKDAVTDVLSFLYERVPLEGEIFICVARARKQARQYGHSFLEELEHLLIHGILHLVGYTHETPDSAEKMGEKAFYIWRSFRANSS